MSNGWFVRHPAHGQKGPYSLGQLVRGTSKIEILDQIEVQHKEYTAGRWIPAIDLKPIADGRRRRNCVVKSQPISLSEATFQAPLTTDAALSVVVPTDQPQAIRAGDQSLDHFMADGQDPRMIARLLQRVEAVCTSQEEIEYMAVQQRPFINFSPDAVVLTNRRILIIRQRILGRMDLHDLNWLNCGDVRLQEGVMTATFYISATTGKEVAIEWLPKTQARKVYRIAQEMEEAMSEHRRNRALEVTRAAAANVVVNTPATATHGDNVSNDPVARLRQLKQMLEAELITQAEFDAKKTDILNRM